MRGAIRAGRSRSGAGDGGRFTVALIHLKDGPLPARPSRRAGQRRRRARVVAAVPYPAAWAIFSAVVASGGRLGRIPTRCSISRSHAEPMIGALDVSRPSPYKAVLATSTGAPESSSDPSVQARYPGVG